jgi:hypothetical protein
VDGVPAGTLAPLFDSESKLLLHREHFSATGLKGRKNLYPAAMTAAG